MSSSGIPYVDSDASEMGKAFEAKIKKLPPEAGILFLSVVPLPVPGGKTRTFSVIVGVDRKFEEDTIRAVMKRLFAKEMQDGTATLTVRVYRGCVGAAHDSVVPGTPSAQA